MSVLAEIKWTKLTCYVCLRSLCTRSHLLLLHLLKTHCSVCLWAGICFTTQWKRWMVFRRWRWPLSVYLLCSSLPTERQACFLTLHLTLNWNLICFFPNLRWKTFKCSRHFSSDSPEAYQVNMPKFMHHFHPHLTLHYRSGVVIVRSPEARHSAYR